MIEKFWIWLAFILPRDLVYWAYMRVVTDASVFYDTVYIDKINIMDALRLWDCSENRYIDSLKNVVTESGDEE